MVSTKADRMGYRLEGVRLESGERGDIASEAVAFGTSLNAKIAEKRTS